MLTRHSSVFLPHFIHCPETQSQAAFLALFVNPLFTPPNNTCCLASISSAAAIISPSRKFDFLFWCMAIPDLTLICAGIMKGENHNVGAFQSKQLRK